jgi:hypothetical protein
LQFSEVTSFAFALRCVSSTSGNILKYIVDLIPLTFENMMSDSVSDFPNQRFWLSDTTALQGHLLVDR